MGKNNIDYSKYVVTLEEYEEFFFECIGRFGMFCFAESERSDERPYSEYGQYHELDSSSVYNRWHKNYEDDYFQTTCHEKYFPGLPDTVDVYKPIYISELECEQIVSILTVEYHKYYFNSRYPFISSLGVKFVKETYFTYYSNFGCHTPSGFTYLPYSNSPVEKWDDEKLFATYSWWFRWIVNSIQESGYKNLNLIFGVLKQEDNDDGPFSCYNLNCFKLAVISTIKFPATCYGPGICFTPRIIAFLFQDLERILRKNMDPDELESKSEVREFIINVFNKVRNCKNDLGTNDEWIRNNLSDYYLFEIFESARDAYPSDSVFHTKCWVRDFTVGNRRGDAFKFFRSKL